MIGAQPVIVTVIVMMVVPWPVVLVSPAVVSILMAAVGACSVMRGIMASPASERRSDSNHNRSNKYYV
jgi:hypothetical protein